MFKGYTSQRIMTTKPKEEVQRALEEHFNQVGVASVSPEGVIRVTGSRMSSFGYTLTVKGTINQSTDSYVIDMDVEAMPDVLAILIAVCFFPVGALTLLLPYNAKTEMENNVNRILQDLRYQLEKA